jgi:ApaG protein
MSDPIEIAVITRYLEDQSEPERNRYVYAYAITISNHGSQRVQLLNRHWVITDSNAKVQEVHGEGVVGQQPILNPGEHFEYQSGCVLDTPLGFMQGSYEFIDEEQVRFKAPIAPFKLAVPGVLN